MRFRTRFAPSPTGPLHLGHAYSAILAFDMAMAEGGEFLLRIEDIDQSRARPEWEAQIFDDLKWLGLHWEEPVLRQSDRQASYQGTLESLWDDQALFACSCSRKDVLAAVTAPQEGAPVHGPDGIVYPGTCNRPENRTGFGDWPMPRDCAFRLDIDIATNRTFEPRVTEKGPDRFASFTETGRGPNGETGMIEFSAREMVREVGDVVLARRDMGTSYHLSVVLDDAHQGITHVIRGEDLFEATKIHVVLQRHLNLRTPVYHHHKLIRDETGKRLAKRDDARAIAKYRSEGASPQDVRRMVGI